MLITSFLYTRHEGLEDLNTLPQLLLLANSFAKELEKEMMGPWHGAVRSRKRDR